jgi:hypothetical protein
MAASNTGFKFSTLVLLPNTESPPNAPAPQAQVPNAILLINIFVLNVRICNLGAKVRRKTLQYAKQFTD